MPTIPLTFEADLSDDVGVRCRVGAAPVCSRPTIRRNSRRGSEFTAHAHAGTRQAAEGVLPIDPNPAHFDDFLADQSDVVSRFGGRPDEQIATIAARTPFMRGDTDFVPAAEVADTRRLIVGVQLAVLPNARRLDVLPIGLS